MRVFCICMNLHGQQKTSSDPFHHWRLYKSYNNHKTRSKKLAKKYLNNSGWFFNVGLKTSWQDTLTFFKVVKILLLFVREFIAVRIERCDNQINLTRNPFFRCSHFNKWFVFELKKKNLWDLTVTNLLGSTLAADRYRIGIP